MRRKAKHKLLYTCLTVAFTLSTTLTPIPVNAATTNSPNTITRIGGTDQYETAAKIAQQGWPQTSDNVILSSGLNNTLVDALAAGPLATKLKAPILLTDNGQALTLSAKAELLRLKPKKVYLTSGTAVIKQSVLEEIQALGITPVPLGGFDQYETSVNIAKEMIALGANVSKVVVTAGWMAPVDALSVSSIASSLEIPILATTRDTLPQSTKKFLSEQSGITDSYVIGGSAVVGDALAGSLPGTLHRFSGATKFDTNLEVLKGFADKVQYDKVYVANGETFVDALSGATLAALTHSPIVLSQSTWSLEMKDFLKLNHLQTLVALGGVVAVPEDILQKLTAFDNVLPTPPVTPPVTTPVIPPTGGVNIPTPTNPVPTSVTISNLQINTNPANSGTYNNGALIDLSGLDGSVKVLGFNLTADQSCTFNFKVFNIPQSISLVAGPQTVSAGDLFLGGVQINGGVTLNDFRSVYTTKALSGQLVKDGITVGTLTINLKFKN